jgi:hypothetical protein
MSAGNETSKGYYRAAAKEYAKDVALTLILGKVFGGEGRAEANAEGQQPDCSMSNAKITLSDGDKESTYAHMLPIVELLLRHGNALAENGPFYQDRDGWRCDLCRPIDFQLVRSSFILPASTKLVPEHDSILCLNTWTVITGPNAAERGARTGSG